MTKKNWKILPNRLITDFKVKEVNVITLQFIIHFLESIHQTVWERYRLIYIYLDKESFSCSRIFLEFRMYLIFNLNLYHKTISSMKHKNLKDKIPFSSSFLVRLNVFKTPPMNLGFQNSFFQKYTWLRWQNKRDFWTYMLTIVF